jgi:hypothetical protein
MVYDVTLATRRRLRLIASGVLGAAAVCVVASAWAGGVDFGPDDSDDAGPPYLGVATDQNGGPVADAKVMVSVAKFNSTIVQRSDSQGHYFIQGFDKSVTPGDVVVVCSKDGYQDATGVKTPGSDPTAPVQVVCTMQKKP